jgi:hypothetical protein
VKQFLEESISMNTRLVHFGFLIIIKRIKGMIKMLRKIKIIIIITIIISINIKI